MQKLLKETISKFFQTDPEGINSDFPLSGHRLNGSLARAQLDAAIRHHVGVKCAVVYSAKTYGELEQAVLGTSSPVAVPPNSSPATSEQSAGLEASHSNGGVPRGISCGIDIEMVEQFPECEDYWNDPFYSSSFTSLEIAYCLLQDHPRMHFAGRWCAKEALKKCQPNLMQEEMGHLEVVSSQEAPPFFRHYVNGKPISLPFALSISHTPLFAVAVVIKENSKMKSKNFHL